MQKRFLIMVILLITICLSACKGKTSDDTKANNSEQETAQELAKDVLNDLFTSDQDRYSRYKESSNKTFVIYETILSEPYSYEYRELYENRCTENCLESMDHASLFHYVDYLADVSGKSIKVKNIELAKIEESQNSYYYTVTLFTEPEGTYSEFDIKGEIILVNIDKKWNVKYVNLYDYGALSICVTGENVLGMLPIPTYPLTEELVKEELQKTGVVADVETQEINSEEYPDFERSAYSIRPPESRLLYAGINNGCSGDDRFLAITFLSFDDKEEISEEEFKKLILFSTRLFGGFINEETIYNAFMSEFNVEESMIWNAELDGVECEVRIQSSTDSPRYTVCVSFYTDKSVFVEA